MSARTVWLATVSAIAEPSLIGDDASPSSVPTASFVSCCWLKLARTVSCTLSPSFAKVPLLSVPADVPATVESPWMLVAASTITVLAPVRLDPRRAVASVSTNCRAAARPTAPLSYAWAVASTEKEPSFRASRLSAPALSDTPLSITALARTSAFPTTSVASTWLLSSEDSLAALTSRLTALAARTVSVPPAPTVAPARMPAVAVAVASPYSALTFTDAPSSLLALSLTDTMLAASSVTLPVPLTTAPPRMDTLALPCPARMPAVRPGRSTPTLPALSMTLPSVCSTSTVEMADRVMLAPRSVPATEMFVALLSRPIWAAPAERAVSRMSPAAKPLFAEASSRAPAETVMLGAVRLMLPELPTDCPLATFRLEIVTPGATTMLWSAVRATSPATAMLLDTVRLVGSNRTVPAVPPAADASKLPPASSEVFAALTSMKPPRPPVPPFASNRAPASTLLSRLA